MTTHNAVSRRTFLGTTLSTAAAGLAAGGLTAERARGAAKAPRPGGWQIGCYTRPWDSFDYRTALDAMAEAGFKHAGLMTVPQEMGRYVITADTSLEQAEEVGRQVKSRGMQIPSVYGGSIPVNESLEAGIAGLRKLIDNCAAAGARSLLMGGTGNEKLYDTYYKAIAECCGYAAEKGLPITVKPHGGLNATGALCRKCLDAVGHENFSLWYDPGNIYYYSEGKIDPVDDAATVDGLVRVGMCIKDFDMVRRDGELARDVWVTPGTGKVDFPAVLKRLIAGGFRGGALVIETVTRPDPTDLKAIFREAKRAREFVEGLVGA